jgi:hypothetical protein
LKQSRLARDSRAHDVAVKFSRNTQRFPEPLQSVRLLSYRLRTAWALAFMTNEAPLPDRLTAQPGEREPGRAMPNVFIRDASVVGLIPSRAAAPSGP